MRDGASSSSGAPLAEADKATYFGASPRRYRVGYIDYPALADA